MENNVTSKTKKLELVFVGGVPVRYRAKHTTLESARATARQVWEKLQERGLPTACHSAIVYGAGCGRDGVCVNPW